MHTHHQDADEELAESIRDFWEKQRTVLSLRP